MSAKQHIYCIDANVLIQAWQKYYSPDFCPDYWDILNELGKQSRIFIPEEVKNEIVVPDTSDKTEDDLSKWLKRSTIPIHKPTENVIACWKKILQTDPSHRLLVDNIKGRSVADPWLIAYAMDTDSTVVTKENIDSAMNSKRVKIPNVCKNMDVRCIDDFEFIKEIGVKFSARF